MTDSTHRKKDPQMTAKEDMAKVSEAMQLFTKSWGEAVNEAFKPLNEAVKRIREQEDRRRQEATNTHATPKYVREGNELVRREPGGSSHLQLPDREGYTIGYWIKPSPFDGTPPWEWVITNMDVTVVTGMSSGYTFTRLSAVEAVRRALCFWASLGYDVVDPDGVS